MAGSAETVIAHQRRNTAWTQASTTKPCAPPSGTRRSLRRRSCGLRPPERLAGGLAEPLDPRMIVLDVAAGPGTSPSRWRRLFVRSSASTSRPLCAWVPNGSPRTGIENEALQEGNAAAPPFADGSSDLRCRGSLHHFRDPQRVVTEMGRARRRGGRVVVSDMVAPSGSLPFVDVLAPLDRSLPRPDLRRHRVGRVARRGRRTRRSHRIGSPRSRIPFDILLNDGSDRVGLDAAVRAELDGGAPTGFLPVVADGQVLGVVRQLRGLGGRGDDAPGWRGGSSA